VFLKVGETLGIFLTYLVLQKDSGSSPNSPSRTTGTTSFTPSLHLTMITGIAHINLTVPSSTLDQATSFYGDTLGLTPRPVPHLQKGRLAWFDIGSSGQQVHIAFGENDVSSRHPCFKIGSGEDLLKLHRRVWEHYERGGGGAPRACDKPGEENSGM
jgi:hypothetical protein